MSNEQIFKKHIIDVVKYRWIWFVLSALLIIPGIVAMIYSSATSEGHFPLKVGIDFTGGTILQYGVNQQVSNDDISKLREALKKENIENPVIQVLSAVSTGDSAQEALEEKIASKQNNENKAEETEKTDSTNSNKIKNIISIRTAFAAEESSISDKVSEIVNSQYGNSELIQVTSVGPTLGKELFKNSISALLLAFLGIVAYLTIRFQLDYAVIAVLALFHDALFILGAFSILGLLFGLQIDSLFITALLTVIGFSVHDTIVVFDRVRENSKFIKKKHSMSEIINASVNQTLTRSINTSLTTLITLGALYIFGGVTTKDFVLAMILGIAIGTYSSIFFASTLLAWWREKKANERAQKTQRK